MITTDDAFQRYFREYLFHQAVQQAREATGEVIPISQARAINARIARRTGPNGQGFLAVLDDEMAAAVHGYEPLFGDHTNRDPNCQRIWQDFLQRTGVARQGAWRSPQLPISPYDPRWAGRSTVKAAGTQLVFLPATTIEKATGGDLGPLEEARWDSMMLRRLDGKGKEVVAGPVMTDEDASGLTELTGLMTEREYARVRDWVLAGARDPRTGRIDRSSFMSAEAVQRSVAVLTELRRQGVSYEVERDRKPGQIVAKVAGTRLEIRLTDTRENQRFAGARIYDNGLVTRYSSTHRGPDNKAAAYTPTPDECVDLLHVAQGRPVRRRDGSGRMIGDPAMDEDGSSPRGYHSEKTATFIVRPYDGPNARPGEMVTLRRDATDRGQARFFVQDEDAQAYLREAVDTARASFAAALDVDGLIAQYDQMLTAGTLDEHSPEFSGDLEIAAIQRSYWDVLTGARSALLQPGVTEEMYAERIGRIGDDLTGPDGQRLTDDQIGYAGDPVEKIRTHAQDSVEYLIGTWEPQAVVLGDEIVDQRFDPVRVAAYMDSEAGLWRNMDSLAAAMRRLHIEPQEMKGTGFNVARMKDRLVRFDPNEAMPIESLESSFLRRMGEVVRDSLNLQGAQAQAVMMDHQGVIGWRAILVDRRGRGKEISGQIGQIFDIGEHGEVVTGFASGENALIVPGYEARIAAQIPGETKTVEERTRLRGYEQLMTEAIQYQIAGDLISDRSQVGEPASLNRVYSQLQVTEHPTDFLESSNEVAGHPDAWTEAILATEARRVRYSNDIKENSTIHATYQDEHSEADPADDNYASAWQLTEGRNMAVLTGQDRNHRRAPAGYFDPVMTGSAKNQGVVRYLVQGAQVAADGSITPSDDPDDRTPLMKRPELDTCRYDPFDRQQMTASALTQSSQVTEPTGVALMTFGGWTADDPMVVSQRFAQTHRIRGTDGRLRDLTVGDKLSDLHGNKGVISLVVDPYMDLDEAADQGIEQEVAWFRNNAHMDVVMSPFSLISRRNAGSARELMGDWDDRDLSELIAQIERDDPDMVGVFDPQARRGPAELLDPTTQDIVNPAGVGTMRFIVTHMAVDAKTKVYDEDAVLQGQGRKASSQLAWALGAQDCPAIMREFYGHNAGAEANLREMMLSVGVDMDADGTLRVTGDPAQSGTQAATSPSRGPVDERPARALFTQPELLHNARGSLRTRDMKLAFGQVIATRGGDLELPFPLTYPTGRTLEHASDQTWRMPVLSSHLRSGQEFEDGTSVAHDYTSRYLDIYEDAFKYREARERLASAREAGERSTVAKMTALSAELRRDAQLKFSSINHDLAQRVFSGKHNTVKSGLMSARLPDSATAVWTADPRLDIDQVAIGPTMAKALGFTEGDHALIWRDPILHDAGLRYLRVTIDDRLTGVAINPVMDQCFDGDFDGDSVAVVRLHNKAAHREALEKLTVPANLLQTGVVDARGNHPLAMQVSLDTQVALSKNPELADEFASLTREANQIEREAQSAGQDADDETHAELSARREDLTEQLSRAYRQAQRGEFGSALSFADAYEHVESMRRVCVDTGAKGSEKKLGDYARILGLPTDERGLYGWEDLGRPGITEDAQRASMYATAVKTFGTGLAGSFSQRAVRALRSDELKAVLELTYPVTQSILQAKHDAAEAKHKYEVLMGPGRDLWRGRLLERSGNAWKPVFEDGEPVQATARQWEAQFAEFYGSPDGFNVPGANPEYIRRVAAGLSDENGVIRNLEDDPGLRGTLMDRMTYGGGLKDLIEAAVQGENLFDGAKNEQFASNVTRLQRRRTATLEQQMEHEHQMEEKTYTPPEPEITAAVLKPDVIADADRGAKSRGQSRRSRHAVAAGGPAAQPASQPVFSPSYSTGLIQSAAESDDLEMGM